MRKELRYLSYVLKIASKTILNMSPGILLNYTYVEKNVHLKYSLTTETLFPLLFYTYLKKTLWINCISWTRVVMIISRGTLLGKMGWGRKEVNWSCCSQRSNSNKGPLAMTIGHLGNTSCWICPPLISAHAVASLYIWDVSESFQLTTLRHGAKTSLYRMEHSFLA